MKKGLYPSIGFARVWWFLRNKLHNEKIYFLMRCSFVILVLHLTFVGLLFSRSSKGQELDQKITLKLEQTGLKESLMTIQRQSNISFVLPDKLFKNESKEVSLNFSQIRVRDAIHAVLNGTNLEYKLVEGFVVIYRKPVPVLLKGKVTDAKTKETLIGVAIRIKGAAGGGTSTDGEGNFSIRIPEEGATLVCTYIGYESKEIKVTANSPFLNISLSPGQTLLSEVTVQARRKTNSEAALLDERKLSATVQDGISAKSIEKTASITTTQALQRVAGVTISDDKYIAVRGLGDRSVIAQLNGARLSSSDPDRSSVPLDIVPASLLDNVTVYKTLSPDRPADASGGMVELKTKSVPDSLTVEFTVQSGFNTNVGLGGQYNGFYNDDLGFFGQKVKDHDLKKDFLDLKDQYPGGLQQMQKLFIQSRDNPEAAAESMRISKIMQSFDPVLTTSYRKTDPNQLYTFSFGNSYKILGGHDLGVVFNANYYQRTEDLYNAARNQYSIYQGVVTGSPTIFNQLQIPNFITPNYPRLGNYLNYQESTGRKTLNYGGLLGLTYRFNARHEIQAQYLGSRGAEASGSNLTGEWKNSGLNFPVYNTINQLKQSYRTFSTFNFQGEHKIVDKSWSPRLSYNLSTSESTHNDPDFRSSNVANLRTFRFQDPSGAGIGTDTYAFVSGLVHGATGDDNYAIVANPNGRQFRKLSERNYNAKADISQPFNLFGLSHLFKFGGNFLRRNRDFNESILGLPGTAYGGGDLRLLNQLKGDINAMVSPKYIGLLDPGSFDEEGSPRIGGFLYQIKKAPNNYSGSYETRAFYGMMDLNITKDLRLIGGVRFESTDIRSTVDTANVFIPSSIGVIQNEPNQRLSYVTDKPNVNYLQNYKPFYSVNLIYNFREDMNFRFAYSTSLARPELRELVNILEFDPFQFALVGGNPNLKNQLTKSADFRWEWFTGPGEVLSASVYTKTIRNQLQRTFNYQSQGNLSTSPEFPFINFQNDPNKGLVYGVELEVRRNLGLMWDPLNHFFIGTNLLLASSTIDKNPERLQASRTIDRRSPATSPIFEQAPYAINATLDYENPKTKTNITASFNMVGARLIQVQLDGTPDLFDRPAPILDLVFSQRLGKYFMVKGFAKNILNPVFKQNYTNAGNKGLFHGTEYTYRQYQKGTEISLGLTYKLF